MKATLWYVIFCEPLSKLAAKNSTSLRNEAKYGVASHIVNVSFDFVKLNLYQLLAWLQGFNEYGYSRHVASKGYSRNDN